MSKHSGWRLFHGRSNASDTRGRCITPDMNPSTREVPHIISSANPLISYSIDLPERIGLLTGGLRILVWCTTSCAPHWENLSKPYAESKVYPHRKVHQFPLRTPDGH